MLLILFYLAPFHKNIGHFGGLQSGSSSLIGDMPAWYPGSEPYSTCGASLENLKVPALFPLANGTINFAAFCHLYTSYVFRMASSSSSLKAVLKSLASCTLSQKSAYPFYKRDPFVLDDKLCPHVLFSGNMDTYDDRLVKGENGQMVRLIAIPKFCETRSVVLLNLKTLESSEMTFELDGMKAETAKRDVVVEP